MAPKPAKALTIVDVNNSNPDNPIDRVSFFDEAGFPVQPVDQALVGFAGRPAPISTRLFPPGVKGRGMNLGPVINSGYGGGWAQMFTEWPWDSASGIKKQIDLAAAEGCNAIRLIGGLGAIKQGLPLATYVQRNEQFIAYARSKGMYVYLVGAAFGHINGATQAELITYLTALVKMTNKYDNVIGMDISQEPFGEGYSMLGKTPQTKTSADDDFITALCAALYNALKPLTKMSLSFSSSTPWTDPRNQMLAPYCDHLDVHVYWDRAGTLDSFLAANPGKLLVVGEFGMGSWSSTGNTANNSTSVTNVTPNQWRNGMLIDGPGITPGTTIVSGEGTTTLVLSAIATATATGVTLTNDSAQKLSMKSLRDDVASRPDVVASFYWAAKWGTPAAGTPNYAYFGASDVPSPVLKDLFRTFPVEDRPWEKRVSLGSNVTINSTNGSDYKDLISTSVTLGRACRVEVELVVDLLPSGTANVYQALVQIDGSPAPDPVALSGLEQRHLLTLKAGSAVLLPGTHTFTSHIVRATGAGVATQALTNTQLRLRFTPA